MAEFTEIEFPFHSNQRVRFRQGVLVSEWSDRYKALFDADDVRLAKSQPNNHFFEWLAAVLLFEATGYLSLLEKYETSAHSRKFEVFREMVPPAVFENVMGNRTGIPDLFVYAPDKSSWFFCEVKGAADQVRPHQRLRADELRAICGKPVRVLVLKQLSI